jgi:hypothetical protein
MTELFNGYVATTPDLLFTLEYGIVPRDAAATGNVTSSELDLRPIPVIAICVTTEIITEFPAPSQEGPARRGPYPGADHK